ncbi:MAG: tape measure protein [Pseudomonadota bacterium]
MADAAEFEVRLADKVSGPAGKAAAGTDDLARSLGKIKGATVDVKVNVTKMDRAIGAAKLAYYAGSAAVVGSKLFKAAGGFEGLKSAAKRAGATLASFGKNALQAGKKVAPFAVGGAGLYGLSKVASTVAVPALGATAIGIAGVTAAAAAATIGVGLLAAKLGALASEKLAGFATFAQDTRFAMANLAKHGAEANKMFDHASKLAAEYGLDVKSTTKQWSKFLALQFAPREADKMIKMGADLQALGTSAEQVEGVFLALGQIRGKGKLQAEEMLQLAERGISTALVYEEIGKLLGKTDEQVRQLQAKGGIDATTGLLAIERAINRKLGQSELGESGKRFANQTITGMVNQIKARADLVGIALGDRLLPSLSRVAGGVLMRLQAFFESARGEKLINRLGDAFDRLGDIAVKALPLVEALMGGLLDRGVEALGGLNTTLGSLSRIDVENAAKSFRDIGKGLADIAIYGGKVIAATGAIVGALGALEASVGGALPSLISVISNPFGTLTEDVISRIVELGPRIYEAGKDLVRGLARGIKDGAIQAVDAVADVGNKVVAKIRGVWDSHSPSRVGAKIGFGFDQGIGVGLYAGAHIPARAAESVAFGTVRASTDVMTARPAFAAGPMLASQRLPDVSSPATAAGGGATAREIRFGDINVYTQATDAEGTARAVRREIDAYFRQLDLES